MPHCVFLEPIVSFPVSRAILTEILWEGISERLNGGTLSQYRYELKYHQLIQEQNDIGWRHIFNGRLALQWSELRTRRLPFRDQQYREAPFRNVTDECCHSGRSVV